MTHPIAKTAVAEYRAKLNTAIRHTPGGVLTDAERAGIAKSVARWHGCTPDDLILWAEMEWGA